MTATDSDEPDDRQLREESDPPDGAGDPEDPKDDKLEVTGVQVAASTLASVSAAAVASLFGVHGTVVGAGVASVVATVGAAVYQRGLDRTSARLHEAPVTELVRPVVTRAGSRLRGGRFPDDPGYESWRNSSRESSSRAVASSPSGADRTSGRRSALAGRRWGVAAAVGAVLVATLAVLSMLEVAAQRPLSGDDRASTSIGAVVGSSGGSSSDDREPEDGTTTTSVPGEDPAEGEGGVEPSSPAPADPDGGGSSGDGSSGGGSDGSPSTTGEAPSTSTTAGGSEPAPSVGSGSGSGSGEVPAGSG